MVKKFYIFKKCLIISWKSSFIYSFIYFLKQTLLKQDRNAHLIWTIFRCGLTHTYFESELWWKPGLGAKQNTVPMLIIMNDYDPSTMEVFGIEEYTILQSILVCKINSLLAFFLVIGLFDKQKYNKNIYNTAHTDIYKHPDKKTMSQIDLVWTEHTVNDSPNWYNFNKCPFYIFTMWLLFVRPASPRCMCAVWG